MGTGMATAINGFMMIQTLGMAALYLVGGIILLIILVKLMKTVDGCNKKLKLQSEKLEKEIAAMAVVEGPVVEAPVVATETTEEVQ